MTGITWKCIALLATLMLAGCAARNADQSLDPGELVGTGLVFASVSTSSEGGDGPVATFRFSKGGFVKSREEQIAGRNLKPSELQEDFGRLIVLELPAGANSLKSWMLTNGAAQYLSSQDFPEISFTVEPGKALYLGNLHMNILMGRNAVNMPVIADLLAEIRGRGERDIALFRSRYPRVANGDIIATQPFLGEWSEDNSVLVQ